MMKLQELLNIFARRLKELMREKNLNIKQLSEETGIPRSTINSWTLAIKSPKIDYLFMIAEFFAVSTDYLLGREN